MKNGISYIVEKSYDSIEALSISIRYQGIRLFITNVHVPSPKLDSPEWMDIFGLRNSIVCWDFNAHHGLWGSSNVLPMLKEDEFCGSDHRMISWGSF